MAPSATQPVRVPGAAFPLDAVAPTLLKEASRSLTTAIKRIRDRGVTVKTAHALRVAARRLEAAISLVSPCLELAQADRLMRHAETWRKVPGAVRSLDVLLRWLKVHLPAADASNEAWTRALIDAVRDERDRQRSRLEAKIAKESGSRTKRDVANAARAAKPPSTGPRLHADAAVERVGAHAAEAAALLAEGSSSTESIHAMRIATKRLRYVLELVVGCLPADLAERALERLEADQTFLGELADLDSSLRVLMAFDATSDLVAAERDRAGAELSRQREATLGSIRERIASGGLSSVIQELVVWTRDASGSGAGEVSVADSMSNATGLLQPREDRIAVIDVGSNSVRLLVVELLPDGAYRTLDDEKETTRLGQGLVSTGMLSTAAMIRTADCIARMRGIAQGYGVSRLRVIGTSAVRDATNQREFLALVRDTAVVTLEVLGEEDEARYAYRSAAAGFDLSDIPAAVVDIGGGSTEIVLSTKGAIEHVCSIPIGAVRVSEMFAPATGMDAVRRMRKYVSRCLRQALPRPPFAPTLVVGTGGTFTALAALAGSKEAGAGKSDLIRSGVELRRSEVRHLLDRLGSMSLRERVRLPRLSPERADIIVGGAAIAEGVLRHLDVNRLRVHEKGVRDGLVLAMIAERQRPSASLAGSTPSSRVLAGARRFAEACRYERAHSEQVARLCMSIFDQFVDLSMLSRKGRSAEARLLLEVAAILHDIGYLVNYSSHHKHSLRLIMNGDLPGLTARQTAIVANIARYHRRSEPTANHAPFARLSKPDRRLVRQLAAILRVADGLDRAHAQAVESVSVRVSADSETPRQMTFAVRASQRPTTDLWGAERKMGLLACEFDVVAACQWELPAAPERVRPPRISAPGISNSAKVHEPR